ncbi:putative gp106-like protein [Esparto virus]|uniref:Putative gp106-like protein n=1 Tax=Esparto virus TaxID=2072209 RepID=A0A2I7G2Z6_9VIRU|nr:putative gp106-like protein [Esparto virus]AUQ44022.1 putative gp106-like protein [Esparto virus]
MNIDQCLCESRDDIARITCIVNAYKKLMDFRHRPLTTLQYNSLLSIQKLSNLKFDGISVKTTTEVLAESQILFTFIQQFVKTHPKFLIDGPDIGDIRLKMDFFSAT